MPDNDKTDNQCPSGNPTDGASCSSNSSSCGCGCSSGSSPWRILIFAVIVVVAIMVFNNNNAVDDITPAPDGASVAWVDDYDAATAKAKEENKPLLLAFHATWCGPCQKMKKRYHDVNIIAASEQFIPVMIDVDKSPAVSQKYNVSGIPTYFITKSDGTIVDNFSGERTTAEFTEKLNSAYALTQ